MYFLRGSLGDSHEYNYDLVFCYFYSASRWKYFSRFPREKCENLSSNFSTNELTSLISASGRLVANNTLILAEKFVAKDLRFWLPFEPVTQLDLIPNKMQKHFYFAIHTPRNLNFKTYVYGTNISGIEQSKWNFLKISGSSYS